MRLYGAIEKIEPLNDGTVRVHGIASSEAVDDQGEIVSAAAIRAALPDYMRFPALREMHQLSAAGTTLEAEVDDDGMTRIVGHVVDPIAVSKVRNKVYRGFSIGGRVTQRDPGNNKTITGLSLSEISLVDRPANPQAVFDIWKASSDMPESQTATAAPFNPPVQIWSCGDASHQHLAKAEAVKCLEKRAAAAGETVDDLIGTPASVDTLTEQPIQKTDPDPQPTATEIQQHAADGAASAQAVIDAALKAVESGEVALAKSEPDAPTVSTVSTVSTVAKDNGDTEMAAKDGDKPYGDVSYADPGHQSDGKKRYPVDTEAHIRAAWSYINKPKNAGKYDAKDLASVKAKIVAAWKAKIDKDGPPSASKKTTETEFSKSLWDIGEVAMLIGGLRAMCERLELERAMEGDDSALPESCEATCASACALLMAMCAEETQEVLADTEIAGPVGPQMNTMMMSAIAQSLTKAIPDPAKVEQLMETLGKAGARHRAETQARLDGVAFATSKAMDVGDLRRAEMISAGDAHKAVLDAGAVAWGAAIEGRQMLTDGNPSGDSGRTQHATVDTGGNGQISVPNPTGASPASPFPKVAKTVDPELVAEIEAMIKANKGGKALLRAAHDLLSDACDGATCKEGTAKPGHVSGRDMAAMHKCHGHLMAVDGVKCGGAPEAAGEAESQGAADTAKVADTDPEAADEAGKADKADATDALSKTLEQHREDILNWGKQNTPVAPEQVWEVARVERDDLAKALASERAEKAELVKTIGAIVPMLDRLTKRVDQIAETPMPARAIANTAVIGVTKAQDGAPLGGQPQFGPGTPLEQRLSPELRAAFAKLSVEDQTMMKIRDQLGQPIAYDPVKRVLVSG